MGKVIKIILSIISAVILTLIIVPFLIFLLLNVGTVQNYAGGLLTSYMSKKLETTVTVDNIRFKLFNRVILEGIYVGDYVGDTLLYAARLDIPVHDISRNGIRLGKVALDAPALYLVQDKATGTTGMRKLLDRVGKGAKGVKPFRIYAAGIQVSDMRFISIESGHGGKNYGIDFDDLMLDDIQVRLSDFTMIGDSISAVVDKISCHEKSGFVLNDCTAARAIVTGKTISVNDCYISTPDSRFNLNHINLTSMTLGWYKGFMDDVSFDADLVTSTVAFPTIAYFAHGLKDWNTVMENVSLSMTGPISGFVGEIRQLNTGGTNMAAGYRISGLPDIGKTRFELDFTDLNANLDDACAILGNAGVSVPESALDILQRLGSLGYTGKIYGLLNDFDLSGNLAASQGTANVNMSYRRRPGGDISLKGELGTDFFDLGSVAGMSELGAVAFNAEVEADIGRVLDINTAASIRSIEVSDYNYRNIQVNGHFTDKDFNGKIHSSDPNLSFDFNGELSFNDTVPEYNFELALHNADLSEIGLNKRDSISRLSGHLSADGSGARLDDMNGTAKLTGVTYFNHSDTVSVDRIDFIAENNPSQKILRMYSPIADIEFHGVLGYKYMISYLQNALTSYLPSISGREVPEKHEFEDTGEATDINNYYIVKADFKEASKLAGIFVPGLEISEGTNLSFMFNPRRDYFSLTANADYIRRGDKMQITDLRINSQNRADSVYLYVSAGQVLLGGLYFPDLSIIGGAKDNLINVAMRFNNSGRGLSALLNTVSTLQTDAVTGNPQLRINFAPSYIMSEGDRWGVDAKGITVGNGKVALNDFRLFSGDQFLTMTGTASASREDTVRVSLNNFDLKPLSSITSRQSYYLEGIINGYANMTSLLKMPLMYSNLDFNSVKINDAEMPDSKFQSYWDFDLEQAGFILSEQGTEDIIMNGHYRPAEKIIAADLVFDSLDLSLLDPVLKGVLRGSRGTASARLNIVSTAGKPDINGKIHINDFSTVVDYTNVPYIVRCRSDIEVTNNVMRLENASVSDNSGNSGGLRATIDLADLKKISYDITVLPRTMQVLSTTFRENELFYGDVYVSDSVNIRGRDDQVRISVYATTAGQSRFFMNVGDEKDISRADFIVFESPDNTALNEEDPVPGRLSIAARREGGVRSNLKRMIDLDLNIRPNTEVQLVLDPVSGSAVKGRGNGNLDIRIDPDNPDNISIYGSYEITEGSYTFNVWNFVTRNFAIEPGSSVHWTGDPMQGQLDITATHRVKASLSPLIGSSQQTYSRTTNVDCIINITGSISDPQISFNVIVPNATPEVQTIVAHAMNTEEMKQNQFIWLLAFKSFASDDSGYGFGTAGATITGIDFIANQIGAIVSSDRFSFLPSVKMRDELSSSEYGGSFYGEIIRNKLYLDVDLMYDSGDNPAVSYNANNNLTGDATLSLLLDESGNFRLQAFSRTIDRYDRYRGFNEYQGLQESGIGIFYREDFDDIADLREMFKRRFTRKNKRNQQ